MSRQASQTSNPNQSQSKASLEELFKLVDEEIAKRDRQTASSTNQESGAIDPTIQGFRTTDHSASQSGRETRNQEIRGPREAHLDLTEIERERYRNSAQSQRQETYSHPSQAQYFQHFVRDGQQGQSRAPYQSNPYQFNQRSSDSLISGNQRVPQQDYPLYDSSLPPLQSTPQGSSQGPSSVGGNFSQPEGYDFSGFGSQRFQQPSQTLQTGQMPVFSYPRNPVDQSQFPRQPRQQFQSQAPDQRFNSSGQTHQPDHQEINFDPFYIEAVRQDRQLQQRGSLQDSTLVGGYHQPSYSGSSPYETAGKNKRPSSHQEITQYSQPSKRQVIAGGLDISHQKEIEQQNEGTRLAQALREIAQSPKFPTLGNPAQSPQNPSSTSSQALPQQTSWEDMQHGFQGQTQAYKLIQKKPKTPFVIEYYDSNQKLKSVRNEGVLDFLRDYFMLDSEDPQNRIGKIHNISGDFQSIRETYLPSYRNKNGFYDLLNLSKYSSPQTTATFYLLLMMCIEKEFNPEFNFDKLIKDVFSQDTGISRFNGKNNWISSDEGDNFSAIYLNFIFGIRLLKNKISVHSRRPTPTETISFFEEPQGNPEDLRRELMIGAYCSLKNDHPALKPLLHWLKSIDKDKLTETGLKDFGKRIIKLPPSNFGFKKIKFADIETLQTLRSIKDIPSHQQEEVDQSRSQSSKSYPERYRVSEIVELPSASQGRTGQTPDNLAERISSAINSSDLRPSTSSHLAKSSADKAIGQ
jgi:hypothetical protein